MKGPAILAIKKIKRSDLKKGFLSHKVLLPIKRAADSLRTAEDKTEGSADLLRTAEDKTEGSANSGWPIAGERSWRAIVTDDKTYSYATLFIFNPLDADATQTCGLAGL